MEYFKRLQELLHTERQADLDAYTRQMSGSSLSARRLNGLSWYPVAIRGSEPGRGDYLSLELERTTHTALPHLFRSGANAALFSNHDPQEHRLEGTISWLGGDRLKLSLREDELPEWTREGKLGIDLLFDNNSYEVMQSALVDADRLAESRQPPALLQVLCGQKAPSFTDDSVPEMPGLNTSQQQALLRMMQANELAIVHGPPGTGKTTTLVQAVNALVRRDGERILVVAPSNAAVDLLSERLSDSGLQVLRIGNPAKVSEHLNALTAETRMAEHPMMKEVKKMRKQVAAYRDMAHKYKRHFGKAEREQRKALFDEAQRVQKDVAATEQYILNDLLDRTQVIAATPVGCDHYMIRNLDYHTVVIDEAGQAIVPACWIPVLKGKKLVLAGDHRQLPPTVKSEQAAAGGLSESMLEYAAKRYPDAVVLLEEQYRMHRDIMGYSSDSFYEGRLQAHPSVAGHLLQDSEAPVEFVDTAGCGFEEQQQDTSIVNPEEATFLIRHLQLLVQRLATVSAAAVFPTIGVIAPYRRQVELLQELLQASSELKPYAPFITANTVDSFQGQERDIIYISMTRSNVGSQIGFLSDIRRMNVAMTRARKKLVVIGDSATLSATPFYAGFIDYATGKEMYKSAWEYLAD